jgi:hypothetical protein
MYRTTILIGAFILVAVALNLLNTEPQFIPRPLEPYKAFCNDAVRDSWECKARKAID